jgi:hypothetical protein
VYYNWQVSVSERKELLFKRDRIIIMSQIEDLAMLFQKINENKIVESITYSSLGESNAKIWG